MGPEVDNFLRFSGEDVKSFDMIILSHMHIDHIGGASHLRSKYGIPVGMGKSDVELMSRIRDDPEWFEKNYLAQLRENGMPEPLLSSSYRETPAMKEIGYYTGFEVDSKLDSSFRIGGRDGIRLIDVPGHSPGSVCVYIPSARTIFTGDHVLRDITPNISKYVGIRDSLGSYISSLKKLEEVDANRALPGHGRSMDSFHERLESIISHHAQRLEEIESIIPDWQTAYQVAGKMRWSRGRSLESMNSMEQIFAIGEATSHLERLEEEGRARSTDRDGVIYYRTSS